MRTNLGSRLVLDMDEDSKRFKRFFASFYACIHDFKYCRPMLFVDGTFLKSKYKSQLLAATTKDDNQGVFYIFTVYFLFIQWLYNNSGLLLFDKQ